MPHHIDHNVPLTIAPEGVHFRREQNHYMCGTSPINDVEVGYDDWDIRHDEFEEQIWPVLAKYVPAFDRVTTVTSWGGQYAYNTLDHNLIIGASPDLPNFLFANGFSGHGMQQGPAVGRAVSELITYGEYRTLDLSELSNERILNNEPFYENVVIKGSRLTFYFLDHGLARQPSAMSAAATRAVTRPTSWSRDIRSSRTKRASSTVAAG